MIVHAFRHNDIRKKDCYRTPMSGGHKYAKKSDPGDLVISHRLRKLFPFSPECKFYGHIDLFKLFDHPIEGQAKSSHFKQWLAQARAAVHGSKLYPMLVFKQNQSLILCAMPAVYPLVAHMSKRNRPQFKMKYNGEDWFIFRFDHVLKQLVKEAA